MASPCLSAAGFRFLDHPLPAEEFGSPYGRRTGSCQTSSGLPCSATVRCGRGGCPLYPGNVVPASTATTTVDHRCFLTSSWSAILRRVDDIGASSRVHLRSSVRSSPCLWLPDGWSPLGVTLRFTPPRYHGRMGRSGMSLGTDSGRCRHRPLTCLGLHVARPRHLQGTSTIPYLYAALLPVSRAFRCGRGDMRGAGLPARCAAQGAYESPSQAGEVGKEASGSTD